MRRLLLLLRVYHVVVWRHTVELKTKLRRTTQDYTETLETLSVLSADHESLLIGYEAALEDGQDLWQELAYQHDKLCEAEDEIAEWQTVAEGVCFSHTQEMNEFEVTKANMSKTISDLLVFLHLLWWFSMALKAEFAARGRLDREDILALRRRLMLVENANFAVAKALEKWRALYEESEVALQEVVELYSQQRATYQAHSRQLLTGLLLLWRYSRNLGQELFDARFRMYMCPASCRRTSDDVMEGINESDLTAEQILSLRFSRTNIAYASLSVQYELLHTELDDVYEDLQEAQQERVAEKEKLQADLSDARKAIEELRTASGAESEKLRSALDEAEKTITTLRAAKDTAEEELENKRNEMVLARVTVQQMRAEVEETKRNLESRVVEWSAFAAGSGRPMLLSEPRDDGDFLAAAGQGVIPLDRRQSPPMLMERRDRTPLLDAPEMVTHPPSASAPIERRMPSGSSSSSQSHSHPSGLALAGLQPPMVCTPSPSHAVSSVIGMPGAIDFPETPVPFRPNISLYSGSPHPIAQPRPVSAQQSSTLFARPRSPRLVIEANSDSDDESPVAYDSDNESPVITDSDNEFPVASDRSSSPEQGYFTPALQASEF
ncbi:hypothetical protein EVJ58_g10287 [Rhodofomes roseus]|uniref:Uncharacterized protein n=1 Tax=Rhodofomes roseus TaxID=34475 RepID=A0A4Y9XTR5_9APHY|nr:hypothetical protein EVJ58_g10287 [Rhodofomes roseus]